MARGNATPINAALRNGHANSEEKLRVLSQVMGNIEKAHGKGAVMRLGDDIRPPIEVIPTGSIALDVALGIGGLPRGRVVEIYGPESSGKCLTADTYVWTEHGLETIAELFGRAGQKASCTSRVTDVREIGLRVVNERGELETVAALTHNNRKPVKRLTLGSGRSISGTDNHPLRVINERGSIVWRRIDQIKVGDVLVSALFGAEEAASGSGLSEDEAVFLGYLVAEGSRDEANRHAVRFPNWDPEVVEEWTALAESLFGAQVRHDDGKEHSILDTALRRRLADDYGLAYTNAPEKTVPHCVRTAGAKVQAAFLSALFEGDGWVDPTSTVGLGTASKVLGEQVQLMLYGLGIPSTLQASFNQTYQRDYYSVIINPSVAHRFMEVIGFRSARRATQVTANFRQSGRDPQFENVPNVSGLVKDLRDAVGGDRAFDRIAGDLFRSDLNLACSKDRLAKIVAWATEREAMLPPGAKAILLQLKELAEAQYTYESVVEVADEGLQPTFDIMLPETHSFIANGVLSHNTTVALHAVANAQKAGGIAAFIDAEHALDPEYAKKLGVDTDNLLVSQPDTGEQALEIADMLIRSGSLDIIVIDSVAALVPRAEIEGEMGDSHVGLQARLMSQALRKLTGALNATGTTAIFINQLREKIGVMFGCMSYSTRVTLADGSTEKIGKIVNQKLPVEVRTYDPETNTIVNRPVTNWFDNGITERFLQFTVEKSGGNGKAQFAATENHLIRTPGGWTEAGELIQGDRVMVSETARLSDQQWQVVLGGLMGDGHLAPNRHGRRGVRFRMGSGFEPHGAAQVDYLDFKSGLLGNIPQTRSVRPNGSVHVDLTSLPELGEVRETVYWGDGKKHFGEDFFKALNPLALAIWYMDDGSFAVRSTGLQEGIRGSGRIEFCVEAMSEATQLRLVNYLRDEYGVEGRLSLRGAGQKAVYQLTTASSRRFQEIVAPYIHPSMEDKLLPDLRGRFALEPEFVEPREVLVPARVLDVHIKPKTRSMHRFDIEVAGTHNYFVDGVMVHNSPETTTGGKALKFYASVRIDVRRIETLKDGTEAVGNRTRAKIVKNKVSPPFTQAEFDILYGQGISREGGLIDMGVDHGFVRKAGAWYTYDGDQLGQGKENARQFLKDNPDLADELERKIKDKLGVGRRTEEPGADTEVPVEF